MTTTSVSYSLIDNDSVLMSWKVFFVGVLYFCFRFGFLCFGRSCYVVDVNGTMFISSYLRSGMERENHAWPLGLGGDSTLARIFRLSKA